jgi:hypothetical protein
MLFRVARQQSARQAAGIATTAGKQRDDVTGDYVVAMTLAAILSQATVLEYGFYAEGSGDVTRNRRRGISRDMFSASATITQQSKLCCSLIRLAGL